MGGLLKKLTKVFVHVCVSGDRQRVRVCVCVGVRARDREGERRDGRPGLLKKLTKVCCEPRPF